MTFVKENPAALVFFALFVAFAMIFAGCSGEKKAAPKAEKAATESSQAAPAQAPEGHASMGSVADDIQKMSHSNIKTSKDVEVSDEVKNTWKEVTLALMDFSTQQPAQVTFQVGSAVQLNDEGLMLNVESFLPDFALAEDKIISRSNDPNNPAVLVSISKGGEVLTRGWVFRDIPEFNSFNDSRFGIQLLSPAKEGEGAK